MINRLISLLRNHFGFSRSETNGMIILLPLMFFTIFSPYMLKKYLNYKTTNVMYEEKAALEWKTTLQNQLIVAKSEIVNTSVHNEKKNPVKTKSLRFEFNANKVTYNELVSLGFSKKTAKNWTNYLKANGYFKKESDLNKIYGISKAHIKSVSSLIKYDRTPLQQKKSLDKRSVKPQKYPKRILKEITISEIDINLTTADDLKKIKGIGEKISERILKYREQLGGFHHIEQLNEVYGLDSTVVNRVKDKFILIEGQNAQISLNSADLKTFSKHPYFGKKLSKIIVNYRKHHGNFKDVAELSKIHIINESILSKITPYLKVD